MPAVEQVELDRHPVLAIPALVLERHRVGRQLEVVRRDVVDVLLDHDLDQQHDHDVARGLEQALVVPAGVLGGKPAGDPVVLAQEQRVEQHEPDLGVRRVAARGEQRVEPLGRDLIRADDLDLTELGLLDAVLVEIRRELGAADVLALEAAALVRPQLGGPGGGDAVERQQVDVVGRVVAARIARRVPVAAQEAVREPHREVGEHHGRLRAQDAVALAHEQVGDAVLGGESRSRHRWEVAARVGPIGQRRPRRVRRERAERVRPRRDFEHGRADQRPVDGAAKPRARVQELPGRLEVRQHIEPELVLPAVALAAAGHFFFTLKARVFAAPRLPAASIGVTTAR